MRNSKLLVLDVEKNKAEWTRFDNNQDLINELNELASIKDKNAYEDRAYKKSHFLGFIGREERMNEKLNNKKNKKRARKNRDY